MSNVPAGAERFLNPKGHVIDGRVVAATRGGTLEVEDPSTGEVFSSIPAGTSEDIDAAVKSARASFAKGEWSRCEPSQRGRVMWEFARKIRELAEPLAWIETRDSGKPITEA